ncbi:hypothetical protein HYU06_06535 [Candidatus Woesearchaeota archaeon]|nr:hypothetical protein [Candidatus Woesearchaeota archaeon]
MPEIDLDAITRVLAPSFNSNSPLPNPMDPKTADVNSFGPNPDSDGSNDSNDSGSPGSETEDMAGAKSDITHKKDNFGINNENGSGNNKNEEANRVKRQYTDPITKEYSAQFNNFRGRPVYEDDIYDKTKFKITGMG